MPIFRMLCNKCGHEERKLMAKPLPWHCGVCEEGQLHPQLPSSINTVTKEMKDARRGVSHTKGLKQQLTKRMNDHHDKHDVVQKIDEFGIDDTKRLGWDKKVKRT